MPNGSQQPPEAYGDSGASSSRKNPDATGFESGKYTSRILVKCSYMFTSNLCLFASSFISLSCIHLFIYMLLMVCRYSISIHQKGKLSVVGWYPSPFCIRLGCTYKRSSSSVELSHAIFQFSSPHRRNDPYKKHNLE